MRARVAGNLRRKFPTVDEAETFFDVNLEGDSVDTPTVQFEEKNPVSMHDILVSIDSFSHSDIVTLAEKIFELLCGKVELTYPQHFIDNSLNAMKHLASNSKPNVVANFSAIIAKKRIPIDRMPWGLLEYNIQFFACLHVNEVRISAAEQLLPFQSSLTLSII